MHCSGKLCPDYFKEKLMSKSQTQLFPTCHACMYSISINYGNVENVLYFSIMF